MVDSSEDEDELRRLLDGTGGGSVRSGGGSRACGGGAAAARPGPRSKQTMTQNSNSKIATMTTRPFRSRR